MSGQVPTLSIVMMGVSCLAGIAIPVCLFFWYRIRKKADVLPFFVGCGVMLLFAMLLESLFHQLVLGSPAGPAIRGNPWLYALYGGLMAGLFEESGRYIAFKYVLRRYHGRDVNALMYGAGHGGFEALAVLSLTMFNNLFISLMINSGSISEIMASVPEEMSGEVTAVLEALVTTDPATFLIAIVERVSAVTLHLALSVLVWFAAKDRSRLFLYPAAILIHLAVDASAVLLSNYHVPVLAIEAAIACLTALAAWFAWHIWKKCTDGSSIPDKSV